MKNVLLSMLLLSLLAAPAGGADTKPLGMEEFTSVDDFAYAIAAFFPKVQGDVTAVQGDTLTLALGQKQGLMTGMVLSVWRDGREILHPVTKAVIGRAEDEVGTAEVTAVQERTATAVMKKKARAPREGDRARITPKKIALAILPLTDSRPDIIASLAERLGQMGRFTLPPNDKTAAFLKDRKKRDASLVTEMGKAFTLDAVVAVSIHPTENKYLVNCQVFAADDGKQMEAVTAMLNLTTKREALGEVRPFFAPVKDLAGRSAEVPFEARYFAIADLDGDGKAEYVFSTGTQLVVSRFEKGAWTEVWREAVPKGEREMQQFALDAADINGNGRPEIFVTRMLGGRVSSYVVEFQDGAYKRVADLPGFVRVLRQPRRGLVLLGQAYDPETFYAGQPRELAWNGSAYAPGAEAPLPAGVNLYNFTLMDAGEAKPLLVSYDKEDRLAVWSGEAVVWRSEEKYRTIETLVMKPRTGLDANVSIDVASANHANIPTPGGMLDKSRRVFISGRMIAVDLAGSGKDDLVVMKNRTDSFSGTSKSNRIASLQWTGTRLEQRWSSPELSDKVLDLGVALAEQGGLQVYGLVFVSGGMFGDDKARVDRFEGR